MNLGTKIIEAVVRSGAIEKAIILENGNQIFVWRSNASEQIEAALEEINNEQTPTPMNDPQNEPQTCPYCDQPRQDTFENRFRFECGTALRADDHKTLKQGDACRLRVELREAQAEVRELREAAENLIRTVMIPDLEHGSNWRVHQLKNDHVRAMRAALAKKEGQR